MILHYYIKDLFRQLDVVHSFVQKICVDSYAATLSSTAKLTVSKLSPSSWKAKRCKLCYVDRRPEQQTAGEESVAYKLT